MNTKATVLWAMLAAVVFFFAGCNKEPAQPQESHVGTADTAIVEDAAPLNSLVGVWNLDGGTILRHDLKVCGKSEIGEKQKKELLPLANDLGSRYRLIMQSDGKWEFHSVLDGRIDFKEKEIFTALTGKECTTDFYYASRFPNDPKRPCGGTWTWTKSDGLKHSGFHEGYPVKNPGPIVIDENTMTFVDNESRQIMVFTYVGTYIHDPDPKYRKNVRTAE